MELIDREKIEWYSCNFETPRFESENRKCSECSHAECSHAQVMQLPSIKVPDNPTNGDMIKAVLQVVGYTPLSIWAEEKKKKSGFHVHIKNEHKGNFSLTVSEDWWNAPYKGVKE